MKVHFISAGDWIRMYVDGKMVDEGHSLDERMVAEAILGKDNVTSDYFEYDCDDNGDDVDESEAYCDYCERWEEQYAQQEAP